MLLNPKQSQNIWYLAMSILVKQDFINHWGSFVLGLCCLWQSLILLFLRKRGSPFLSPSWAPSPPDQILPHKMSDRESYFWIFLKIRLMEIFAMLATGQGLDRVSSPFLDFIVAEEGVLPMVLWSEVIFQVCFELKPAPLTCLSFFRTRPLLVIYSYSWPKYTQCRNFELASTRL